MKIYTASKTKHAHKWIDLRSHGYDINSTWIDEAVEGESQDLADLSARCMKEAAECDYLLLYCEPDEILKGALWEIGAAISNGKTAVIAGDCQSLNGALPYHKNVIRLRDLEEALCFLDCIMENNNES